MTSLKAARPQSAKRVQEATRPKPTTIPETMKAAAIDRFGPPSSIKVHTLSVPQLGPNDILIAVHSAGVGVWDASIRDGSWRPTGRPEFPIVLGLDGSGTVVAKGGRVRRFAIGDSVYAVDFAGFSAEYVAIPADHAGRVPKTLDLLQAGAAAVPGLTALQGIDDSLRMRPDETVLIFGASGAVGTVAVQFARLRGARVIATASGDDAQALVRRLGAEVVIDARGNDAVQRLRKAAPDGIDAALVLASGDALEAFLGAVVTGGRVAYPNGVEPEPRNRRNIRVLAYDGLPSPAKFDQLERAANEARLQMPIAAVYSLAEAAKAHRRLEQGHVVGRIALRVAPTARKGNDCR